MAQAHGSPIATPLADRHQALGARMVEFAGWLMPVQYAGILEEHRAVRTRAGLFDLSHMGEVNPAIAAARPTLEEKQYSFSNALNFSIFISSRPPGK